MNWAADPAIRNILAAGGIRSGKTITICTIMMMRAMRAPGSNHGFFHQQFNICKRNLFQETFPETLEIILPGYYAQLKANNYVNGSDFIVRLPNGSKFFFMGLDDPDKVRGMKFSTIFLNEANFVDYKAVSTLRGRLSESAKTVDGAILDNKMFFDLNPTVKSSWDYQVFVDGKVPGDRTDIPNFNERYKYLTINAIDNRPNLPDSLFEEFEAMTEEQRRRDQFGMWSEDNPTALFKRENILRLPVPVDFKVITVNVDPAGSVSKTSDLTGITVTGLDNDGRYHVLEDATGRYTPEEWAQVVGKLFKDYEANWIVAEENYGGLMVKNVLERNNEHGHRLPIKMVRAKRGKKTRAEPVSVLYEKGLVNHADLFRELEDQMMEFDSPSFKGSPDRVDAMVWGLTFLSELGHEPATPVHIGNWRRF